jgi:hypothetical protein
MQANERKPVNKIDDIAHESDNLFCGPADHHIRPIRIIISGVVFKHINISIYGTLDHIYQDMTTRENREKEVGIR